MPLDRLEKSARVRVLQERSEPRQGGYPQEYRLRTLLQEIRALPGRRGSAIFCLKCEERFRIRATYGVSQTWTQPPSLALAENLLGHVVCTSTPRAALRYEEKRVGQYAVARGTPT